VFALEAPGYARWCGHATDDEPWYLARVTTVAIFGYVALQLAIGVWVGRRVRTEDDYLVAGRSLGPIMTTFTVFATWFGAETCVGAAGIAYERGLAGNAADPFGYGIAVVLVGAFLAARLYGLRITTIADLLRTRYGADVEKLAALLMIPTSLLWAAAQIRAFGQILGGATGLEVPLAITIAAAVVLTYTSFGGMLADAYTDLVQGTVLLIGLGVVGFVLLPGADVAAIEPERLRLVDPNTSVLETMESWAVPILGSLVAQELVARVLSARSATIARRATVGAGLLYLAVGVIPVAVGLLGAHALPGLDDPEQILVLQAERALPTWAHVIFVGALVSAILSTVDSALLVAGSLLAHNVLHARLERMDERGRVRANRLAVGGFGVVAYGLALSADRVYALVEEASAFGTAGILVVVVLGLRNGFGGRVAAWSALVLAVVVYVVASHATAFEAPYLLSLAVALAAFVFGGLVDRSLASRPA